MSNEAWTYYQEAERFADALIEIAVRNGPRKYETIGGWYSYDPAEEATMCSPGDESSPHDYCTAARALGIL